MYPLYTCTCTPIHVHVPHVHLPPIHVHVPTVHVHVPPIHVHVPLYMYMYRDNYNFLHVPDKMSDQAESWPDMF